MTNNKQLAAQLREMADKLEAENNEPELFEFGKEFILSYKTTDPVFIGYGFAPDGYEYKCLIPNYGWIAEIIKNPIYASGQAIIFKKVK